MLPISFDLNTPSCSFTYTRTREGPNYFVSYYKGSTRGHTDPKECWRTLGVAKFTDTGKALKQWCLDMNDQYVTSKLEPVKDTSFASDVAGEVDPTAETKMIT